MFEGTSCINDPIIISPDLAFRAEATTGEGSIWHPDRNTLFWVDIEGKTLYEYIPDLQNCRSWQFDRMVSTVVPETDSTVVVALQNEIIRVNLTDGNTTSIAPIPDNNGRFVATMGNATRPDAYGSAPWDLARLKGLPAFIVYGQTEPSKQS